MHVTTLEANFKNASWFITTVGERNFCFNLKNKFENEIETRMEVVLSENGKFLKYECNFGSLYLNNQNFKNVSWFVSITERQKSMFYSWT